MSIYDDGLLADANAIIDQAFTALRPPPRLTLSEWADANFRLSADAGAAEPGPWRTYPYQREIMDAMSDPEIESVTIAKSARVGYSEMLKSYIGYLVEHDPCPIMLVQPTEKDAKNFSKENIDPLIRDVPIVGARFRSSRRQPDAMLFRRFSGGVLHIVGANSPGNARRVSRRVILLDELDGYARSLGREGDPLLLFEKRAESFWNRKHIRGSSLTDRGFSRTERLFLEGDQRRRYFPCPACGEKQILKFPNLNWKDRPVQEAVFICIFCSAEIEHARYRWMDEHAEWRPGPHAQFPNDPPPGTDPRHRSYHVWSAYSYMPNATWGHCATEFITANNGGPEQLKTFVNTWLGETWAERGDVPDWRRLYDRREAYKPGTCPRGVLVLTAGVDVQRDRIVFELVGWGRGKESWSIDSGVIPGAPSDFTSKGPWAQIDALLDRSYPHEGGQQMRVRMMAVDSGDQTQTVYNWVRSKDQARVMAVKGSDSSSVLVSAPTKVDVSVAGRPIGQVLLWRVGRAITSSELYGWLKLDQPTDEERAAGAETPPGYCHFPEYGESFFKELTALQLVTRQTPRGPVREWQVIPGLADHFHSCRRYARAAAFVVGLDRSKESDWAALEKTLDVTPPTPPKDAPPTPPAPETRPRRQPWLGDRRPGGWLKKR